VGVQLTKDEKDGLMGIGLFTIQHVPCADSYAELVTQRFTPQDSGQVTIDANCSKCGAVYLTTVSVDAMREHLANPPSVAGLIERETRH
jgi:hypothetical protein